MVKKIPSEIWKPLEFPGWKQLRKKYAVSSHGRVVSYISDIHEDGKLLNGSITTGYRTLNLHRSGSNGTLYIHREVARVFLRKSSPKQKYVIHQNFDKLDNGAKNLRWASLEEMVQHQQKSPAKIAYKKVQANRTQGLKLSISDVRSIKKTLSSRTNAVPIKKLAEKYGVSEMTLYRIKSGENWSRVK
jgi:hypothetical protein